VIKPAVFKFRDDSGREVEFTSPYAISKIARVKPIALDEFEFLRGITRLTGKVTLPAPSTMHFYRCTDYADPKAYSDPERLFNDLGLAYREEIAALAQAGCRYVQIDEVAVAMLCDPAIRERINAAKQEPDALVQLYTDAINKAVEGAPKEMTIGVHVCRGNFKGNYLSDGGYAPIAERFFGDTKVNHFLLEYDTPRAGDFAPLRFVPKDKGVVLGLISTKTAKLEDLDSLKRRTDEAAKHVDLDRLAISPQCGFASTVAGNPVTEKDERAKLRRVVEAADAIWR
jgi:5-methyltetrahydropteroyltriglutamate--homocysteine methyltransferase